MKLFNIKDHFESVYLLESRFMQSVTQESEEFIKDPEIRKLVYHIARLSYNKNKYTLSSGGMEIDDLFNIGLCLSMVFKRFYSDNFKTKKHMTTSLCRFLGQKFYNLKLLLEKKVPESSRSMLKMTSNDQFDDESSYISILWENYCESNKEEKPDTEELITRVIVAIQADRNGKGPKRFRKVNNLRRMAKKYKPRTIPEIQALSPNELSKHESYELAHQVLQRVNNNS